MGVVYELSVSKVTENILWVHGHFSCGSWPDLQIFQKKLVIELSASKKKIMNKRYRHERSVTIDAFFVWTKNVYTCIRTGHEWYDAPFKYFKVLQDTFCFNTTLHGQVFLAVAKVLTLGIFYNDPLLRIWQVATSRFAWLLFLEACVSQNILVIDIGPTELKVYWMFVACKKL